MIERKIAQAIEPLLDEIVSLERKLNAVQLQPGPAGDAGVGIKSITSNEDRIAIVLTNETVHEFELPKGLRGEPGERGEAGAAGADGVSIVKVYDEDDQIHFELSNGARYALALPQGKKGDPGERGLPGEPGPRGDDGLDGEAGLPGPAGTGVDSIYSEGSKAFVKLTNGNVYSFDLPAGEKGERGEKGLDGAPGERGERGLDGRDGIGIKAIRSDGVDAIVELDDGNEYLITLPKGDRGERGERGERGDAGADGLGIQTKSWEPGIYREGTFVTAEIGRVYKAVKDTNSIPGKSEDWVRVGSGGFAWKGVKKADANYQDGDFYIDGGSTFMWLNGKGHMFAQRGPRGEAGPAGKDGTSAPSIVEMMFNFDEFVVAMSDGSVQNANITGLKEYLAATQYNISRQAAFSVWEEQQTALAELGVPVTVYRGYWRDNVSYNPGEIVTVGKQIYICKKKASGSISTENWELMGGGGGGGGAASTRPPAASPFNVVPFNFNVPASGAADGDTYFSFEDKLLRIWDATKNQWTFPAGLAELVPDENSVRGMPGGKQGMIRFALKERSAWIFTPTGWQALGNNGAIIVDDQAARLALPTNTLKDGQLLVQKDKAILWVLEAGIWNAVSSGGVTLVPNLVALNGIVNAQNGDLAFRQDTEQMYVRDGVLWRPTSHPIHMFADNATLMAATLPDGVFGYQLDQSKLFVRTGNVWKEAGGGRGVINVADSAERLKLDPLVLNDAGALVYQKDTGVLWQYTGPTPITPASVMAGFSWTQLTPTGMTGKVIPVDNAAALPTATAAAADLSNPLYLIKEDDQGNVINQLVVFERIAAGLPGTPGVWINPTPTNYLNALLADPDRQGLLKIGDIQLVTEPDHTELKVWDGTAWQNIYSEDLIRRLIAAGSLFQGTVMPSPVAGGATALEKLPVPSAQWLGNYWTWVGPSNYEIKGDSTDPNAKAVTIVPAPPLPSVAGAPVNVLFNVAGGAGIGEARQFTLEYTLDDGTGPQSFSVTTATLPATATATDIADAFAAAFIAPSGHALTLQAAAGVLDFQPDTKTLFTEVKLLTALTPMIGGDLGGEILQVGDWIQVVSKTGGGYQWAHVPSDLLSKLRGDRLYSIQPWAAGAWEVNSVVNYDGRLWRAVRAVAPVDPHPQPAGVPITVYGTRMIGYPDVPAGVSLFLMASPPVPNNTGDYIILNTGADGTYPIPGGAGSITAVAGDAIVNTGNTLLGVGGYLRIPGPFPVTSSPAATIDALPRNTQAEPQNALPVAGAARFQSLIGGTYAPGQRLVATQDFTVPAGLPFAGQNISRGDTFWWTSDPVALHSDHGWMYSAANPLGATDSPPFVSGTTPLAQRITSAAVGQSQLDGVLAGIALSNLRQDDVITVSTAGTLGVAATNATAGTALAVGDWFIVTDKAAGEFEYHAGPFVPGASQQVQVNVTFRRWFGSSWLNPGTDDIADVLNGNRQMSAGDQYGYMGGGDAKVIPASWTDAGNLAGTALPNNNGTNYIITCTNDNPFQYGVSPAPGNNFPANGAQTTATVSVTVGVPVGSFSAASQIPFTWADFANTANFQNFTVGGVTHSLSPGSWFLVDEPTPAVPAGVGSGNLAGQAVAAGDRLMLTSLAPLRWEIFPAASPLMVQFFYEGNQPTDPTTLTYNKPVTFTAPIPAPQRTVPGVPAGASPWTEIPIEGNWHTVLNDAALPAGGAPADQVYFVVTSAVANGSPALYSWVNNKWTPLGGTSNAASGSFGAGIVFPVPPIPDSLFYRLDEDQLYYFDGTNWQQLTKRRTGLVQPANGILGDLIQTDDAGIQDWKAGSWLPGSLVLYGGGIWRALNMTTAADPAPYDDPTNWTRIFSGRMVGEIKMWPSAIVPPYHLLCDGSKIPPQFTELITLIGPNLPDLRGQFVRGGTPEAGFTKHRWTTGRPRTNFTTNANGNHTHTLQGGRLNEAGNGWAASGDGGAGNITGSYTSSAGSHDHIVNGGGDSETAPDHVLLSYIICAE